MQRWFVKVLPLLLLILMMGVVTQAQTLDSNVGSLNIELNVRIGPENTVIGQLPKGTVVVVESRSEDNTWALVHTPDNATRGWVASGYLYLQPDFNFLGLPVSSEVVPVDSAVNPPVYPVGTVVTASVPANIRTLPNPGSMVGTAVLAQTPLVLHARTPDSLWAVVQTAEFETGWIATETLTLPPDLDFSLLPVIDTTTSAPSASAAAPAAPAAPAGPVTRGDIPVTGDQPYADASIEQMIERLNAIPVLYQFDSPVLPSIFQRGQRQNNRPGVFMKVGDSITAIQWFMVGFSQPDVYSLGQYGGLQGTIDFFSEPVIPGQADSFLREGMAMDSAFNAGTLLDPLWADPDQCESDETPLACEVRLTRPSVALIMLGSVDMQIYGGEYYYAAMETIVAYLSENGVIPVLTTFPVAEEYIYWKRSLEFNMLLIDLAETYRIPLINLWAVTRTMPQNGTDYDLYHLSQTGNDFVFDGREAQYGLPARNLISLQALEQLRLNVLGG